MFLPATGILIPEERRSVADRQPPSSIMSAATKTDPATTHSLAVVRCVASIVGQYDRVQSTIHHLKCDRIAGSIPRPFDRDKSG